HFCGFFAVVPNAEPSHTARMTEAPQPYATTNSPALASWESGLDDWLWFRDQRADPLRALGRQGWASPACVPCRPPVLYFRIQKIDAVRMHSVSGLQRVTKGAVIPDMLDEHCMMSLNRHILPLVRATKVPVQVRGAYEKTARCCCAVPEASCPRLSIKKIIGRNAALADRPK